MRAAIRQGLQYTHPTPAMPAAQWHIPKLSLTTLADHSDDDDHKKENPHLFWDTSRSD